jgi:hypothetical protein
LTWPVSSSILGWKKGSNSRACKPCPTSANDSCGVAPRARRFARLQVVVHQRHQAAADHRLADRAQHVDAVGSAMVSTENSTALVCAPPR